MSSLIFSMTSKLKQNGFLVIFADLRAAPLAMHSCEFSVFFRSFLLKVYEMTSLTAGNRDVSPTNSIYDKALPE